MKLKHIDIENFRSIKDSSISFDEYPCRILIGMNETGKSNILKAIKTLDSSYNILNSAPEDKRFPPGDEVDSSKLSFVDFCFDLEEKDISIIYSKLKSLLFCRNVENTKIFQKAKNTFTLKELIEQMRGIVVRVNLLAGQRYNFCWPLDIGVKELTIVSADNWKEIPFDISIIVNEENKKIERSTYKYIKTNEFPNQAKPFTEGIDINTFYNEVLLEINSFVNTNLPQVIFWENFQDHTFHADIDIQKFITDPNTYPHFKSMCLLTKNLFQNADSISQVFQEKQRANQLGMLYQQISDKATDYLHDIWDDFKDERLVIDSTKKNSVIGISVENSRKYSNPFPVSFRSDGFKKFLKLMLELSLKINASEIRNSIILIDEAELYLHPPAAEDFRDELLSLAEKNNNIVVFSTHSPFMIDGNAIKRHIIVKKENETTILKEGEEGKWFEEELLWQALGCGVIRTLPHKTLIFEGWDDKVLFKTGLSKLDEAEKEHISPGDKSKLAIAHAAGASHIRHYLPAFQAANSKAIIVCDSDQAGRDEKKFCEENRLWGHDTFFTFEDLGGKIDETAEDYLTMDRINNAIEEVKEKFKIPTNPDFSIENYRIMAQVKMWLQNEKKNNIDKIIEILKDSLFRKLEPAHIKDEYKVILKNLDIKLSKLKEGKIIEKKKSW